MSETKYLSKKECISQLVQQIAGETENETLNEKLNAKIHPDIDDDMLISDGNVDVDTLKEYNNFVFIHNEYGEKEVLSIAPRKPEDEFITEIHLHDGFKQYDVPPSQLEKFFKEIKFYDINLMSILQKFVNTGNYYYRLHKIYPTITMEISSDNHKIHSKNGTSPNEIKLLPNFKYKEIEYDGGDKSTSFGKLLNYPDKSLNDSETFFTVTETLTWTVNTTINGYNIQRQLLKLQFSENFKTHFKSAFDFINVEENTITIEKTFEYKKDENGITLLTDITDLNDPVITRIPRLDKSIFRTQAIMIRDEDNVKIVFPLPLVEDSTIVQITYNSNSVRLEIDMKQSTGVKSSQLNGDRFSISLYGNKDISIYFTCVSGTINESTFTLFLFTGSYISYGCDCENFGTETSTIPPQSNFTIDYRSYEPAMGIQSYTTSNNTTWKTWIEGQEGFSVNSLNNTIIYGVHNVPVKDVTANDKILHNAEYCVGAWPII